MIQVVPQDRGLELKSKTASVRLNNGIHIGEFELTAPGEYEIVGVSVLGVASGDGVLFRFLLDEIAFFYPLGLTAKPTSDEMERLGAVEVLIVEDVPTNIVSDLMQQSDARQIILLKTLPELDKLNMKNAEQMTSLKIDRKSLPEGDPKAVIVG